MNKAAPASNTRPAPYFVGQRAEKGLSQAPDEALERDGEAEAFARDSDGHAHRLHEQPEAAAQAHAHCEHQGSTDDQE